MSTRLPTVVLQLGQAKAAVRRRFGDFADWFCAALAGVDGDLCVIHPYRGEALPAAQKFGVAILTGSPAMVTDRADWSERTAAWVRAMMGAGKPLFGVCYGHQLMADALGGVVGYNPRGQEIGTHEITLSPAAADDSLLADWPAHFDAILIHEQTVLQPPDGAVVLASSSNDAHQVLRYGPRALSVQFHPEFTPDIIRTYIEAEATSLRAAGADVDALLARVTPAPHAVRLMREFIAQCLPASAS